MVNAVGVRLAALIGRLIKKGCLVVRRSPSTDEDSHAPRC